MNAATRSSTHAASAGRPGTVVVWENLDRVLPERYAESGWGRRRLNSLCEKTAEHLSMVFHRFIAGTHGLDKVAISVGRREAPSLGPVRGLDEQNTRSLAPEIFEVEAEYGSSDVTFRGYVLRLGTSSRRRSSSSGCLVR